MTVLIIDDDAEDTEMFCEALTELFPEAICHTANSCEKIAATLDNFKPDIIFMDGHMFPTNGAECLKKLNELVDRGRVKIIVHSGSLSPAELNGFTAVGVDDVLIKASSYKEIKSNLVRILVDKYKLAARPENHTPY
jgi:response regulator of citrate/malate metabolism